MALVEAHLTTCAECRAEVDMLSHVVGLMNPVQAMLTPEWSTSLPNGRVSPSEQADR
jgi:predicted anti-sigma-YlaC factor YlaD